MNMNIKDLIENCEELTSVIMAVEDGLLGGYGNFEEYIPAFSLLRKKAKKLTKDLYAMEHQQEENDGCELIDALRKYYENNSRSYKKDISDAIVNILKKYNVSANDIGDILITLPKKLTLNVVRDRSSEE